MGSSGLLDGERALAGISLPPADCTTLGIGCADTYGADLNTNSGGPRSDVNAFSGYYDYPFNVSSTGPSD